MLGSHAVASAWSCGVVLDTHAAQTGTRGQAPCVGRLLYTTLQDPNSSPGCKKIALCPNDKTCTHLEEDHLKLLLGFEVQFYIFQG